MNQMSTTQQPQHAAMITMAEQHVLRLVISQMRHVAMNYTEAVMTAINPQLRDMFKRMLDLTLQHHDHLLRRSAVHGVYGSELAVRQEDVQHRIVWEQQSGNDLHAYVHHHLRYEHTGTPYHQPSQSMMGSAAEQYPPQSTGMMSITGQHPSQPMELHPSMNRHDMNQVQAHQPGMFGFNQEFGHQEAPRSYSEGTHYPSYEELHQLKGQARETLTLSNHEPPHPSRRTVYSEQQIGALSTPGAGVYQSASRGASVPMTGSKVTSNHSGESRSKHES